MDDECIFRGCVFSGVVNVTVKKKLKHAVRVTFSLFS